MMQMTAGGEAGHRLRREKGGMDFIDLEVWFKDYMDKFQHNPTTMDPSRSGPHLVGIRRLTEYERTQAWYHSFEEAVNAHDAKYFNGDMDWQMLSSQIDCCQGVLCCWRVGDGDQKSKLRKLFCSVLAAEIYKGVGLLDESMASSEHVPAMFDTTRKLRLQGGAKLSKEFYIVGPTTEEERQQVMHYPPLDPAVQGTDRGGGNEVSVKFGAGGFWGVDVTKPLVEVCARGDKRVSLQYSQRENYVQRVPTIPRESVPRPPEQQQMLLEGGTELPKAA